LKYSWFDCCFCLFAEDTGIFSPKDAFSDLLETFTNEDGSDSGPVLDQLFRTLNRKDEARQKSLPEHYRQFPYVNGRLFEESLEPPVFNRAMRDALLELTNLNWGAISPAIFGAMFQTVIEWDANDRRRQLGAHYTSEENILKVIKPLFLDELQEQLARCKDNVNKLFEFKKKLRYLTFLDPACGCGNFLVISYRELRRLELDVIRESKRFAPHLAQQFQHDAIAVNVDQFNGIEIEEFPSQVAQVAMWLMDHQMNIEASELLGKPIFRIPLEKSANVRRGNALDLDWSEFVPPQRLHYILGNPPFSGAMVMSEDQHTDMDRAFLGAKGIGVLDYVAGWYIKAAHYLTRGHAAQANPSRRRYKDVEFTTVPSGFVDDIFEATERDDDRERRKIKCAFVSTNSISQGEQVGILWRQLLPLGIHIQFAHRTFRWSNEAPGVAAVHCVIIGFAATSAKHPRLFDYDDIAGDPHEITATNINPYLLDGPDLLLENRSTPLCSVPAMRYGSMPRDDGNLILTAEDRQRLLAETPEMAPFVKLFLGAHEFVRGGDRYCLWLIDASPSLLNRSAIVRDRLKGVREFRLASKASSTRKFAETPSLFCQIAQPAGKYVLVPRHSSENRKFVPMGFFGQENIVADSCLSVPDATLYHFGILSSTMHNAWMRVTCGRLESRYRYSKDIVYNNFPWPRQIEELATRKIEAAAQSVLDARAAYPGSTLADLYDPLSMPPLLMKAHDLLDRAVESAYVADGGKRKFASDAERVAFLFNFHQKYTSLLST
jgi:hypothetical protein